MSQKTTNLIKKMIATIALVQVVSNLAVAAENCHMNNPGANADVRELAELIKSNFGGAKAGMKKVSIKNIYDGKDRKVDRTLPIFHQLNAVGIMTHEPKASMKYYGTSVLISPCHVIVNRHTLLDKADT